MLKLFKKIYFSVAFPLVYPSSLLNYLNLNFFRMSRSLFIAALVAGAIAAPASSPSVSKFGPDSQISASVQPSTTGYREEYLQSGYASATFHGPYSGTPTTTGAANGPTTLAASVGTLPPNPTATYYNSAGIPLNPMPAPYTPAGGLGTNGSLPRYMVESDFDFESIALGLYQVCLVFIINSNTSLHNAGVD